MTGAKNDRWRFSPVQLRGVPDDRHLVHFAHQVLARHQHECRAAVVAQKQQAVRLGGRHVAQALNHFGQLADVRAAQPRLPLMRVHMRVDHATALRSRQMHRRQNRLAIDPGADERVVNVSFVADGVVLGSDDQLRRAGGVADLRRYESNPLSRVPMRPMQVLPDAVAQRTEQPELNDRLRTDHLNAPRCAATICFKVRLGSTLYEYAYQFRSRTRTFPFQFSGLLSCRLVSTLEAKNSLDW